MIEILFRFVKMNNIMSRSSEDLSEDRRDEYLCVENKPLVVSVKPKDK